MSPSTTIRDIRLAGSLHGGGKTGGRGIGKIAALLVNQLHAVAQALAQTAQDGDTVMVVLAPAVVAELDLVGIGANHRDRFQFGRIERQQTLSFFSSTMDSSAIRCASATCSALRAILDQMGQIGVGTPVEQPTDEFRVQDPPAACRSQTPTLALR